MLRGLRRLAILLGPIALILLLAGVPYLVEPVGARHAKPHWARTDNPVDLAILDSTTDDWADPLATANANWNQSPVLEDQLVPSDDDPLTRGTCPVLPGQLRVCNAPYCLLYPDCQWYGKAYVEYRRGHIVAAIVLLNDSIASDFGASEAGKRAVVCHELGHAFGLPHQRASTCMNDRVLPGQYDAPNARDYAALTRIYRHVDRVTTIAPAATGPDGTSGWSASDVLAQGAAGRHGVTRMELPGGRTVVGITLSRLAG
jgi:hypothetical protein